MGSLPVLQRCSPPQLARHVLIGLLCARCSHAGRSRGRQQPATAPGHLVRVAPPSCSHQLPPTRRACVSSLVQVRNRAQRAKREVHTSGVASLQETGQGAGLP